MSGGLSAFDALDRAVRSALIAAGLDPAPGLARHPGELRLLDGEGRAMGRVVARERGGLHVDLDPKLGGAPTARRLEEGAARILEEQATSWRTRTAGNPWHLPFDRGPGIYPLEEVDLCGVAARLVAGRDVRVVYLEATCLADCVFCGHVEDRTDGLPERLALACLEAGQTDIRGAYALLGGPEPTGRPDLERWIAALRGAGATRIGLIGTGEALADRHLVARLRDAGLDEVSLPVYGGDAMVHDGITRRPGSFARLTETLAGLKDSEVDVHLHGLLLQQNTTELNRIADWAGSVGHRVLLGLPREKQEFARKAYAPDFSDVARAVQGTRPALGFGVLPRCGRAEARLEPTLSPIDLDAWGPFAIYLGVQAGQFAPACEGCSVRDACAGLPVGLASPWATSLRPVAS